MLRSLLERWNPDTNTFLFQSSERTVTLLDMHKLAALPLYGEFYEEFIPPDNEREPSTLLYPKCLSQLLKVWEELQVDNKVSVPRVVRLFS